MRWARYFLVSPPPAVLRKMFLAITFLRSVVLKKAFGWWCLNHLMVHSQVLVSHSSNTTVSSPHIWHDGAVPGLIDVCMIGNRARSGQCTWNIRQYISTYFSTYSIYIWTHFPKYVRNENRRNSKSLLYFSLNSQNEYFT